MRPKPGCAGAVVEHFQRQGIIEKALTVKGCEDVSVLMREDDIMVTATWVNTAAYQAWLDHQRDGQLMGRYRISMDIGGTFTDAVAYDEETGQYTAGKASTTPGALSVGVRNAMGNLVDDLSDLSFIVHGTTQGLNAFLQRRGEKVLLIASSGAGDVYQIARGNRTELYEIQYRKPEPLVTRSDTQEVGGRLDSKGVEIREPCPRA